LPKLQVNADQLTQVFMNLIINALDVMPTGGILTVSTRLDRVSDTSIAQIDVTDTGSGIGAAVLPHIFEPFFTTKPNGVGLGLAISYEIIQSSGGEVVAVSQLGAGTTFSVRLPLPANSARVRPKGNSYGSEREYFDSGRRSGRAAFFRADFAA